jgi:hypothetical protein
MFAVIDFPQCLPNPGIAAVLMPARAEVRPYSRNICGASQVGTYAIRDVR